MPKKSSPRKTLPSQNVSEMHLVIGLLVILVLLVYAVLRINAGPKLSESYVQDPLKKATPTPRVVYPTALPKPTLGSAPTPTSSVGLPTIAPKPTVTPIACLQPGEKCGGISLSNTKCCYGTCDTLSGTCPRNFIQ